MWAKRFGRLLDCFRLLHLCMEFGKHIIVLWAESEARNRMCGMESVSAYMCTSGLEN